MKERETFGSRLGFILVSAGCAIGLGNVWKFPYMAGKYGGAAFILIYLIFLVLLGLPVLVCEFAVGRASRKSTARAFHDLEPEGANFHNFSYMSMVSNYVLMMFYTMVAGWMLYYCYAMAAGKLDGKDSAQVADYFTGLQDSAGTMTLWMIIVVVLSFGVCSLGVQRGLEKITKVMMICLLALIVVLAVHSLTLDGAMEGVKFYLVPDFAAMAEIGIGNVIFGALSQAFFYIKYWCRLNDYFRKLSWKGQIPSGRIFAYYDSGYFCCIDGRIDHYSGMLRIWCGARSRPGTCIYYIA